MQTPMDSVSKAAPEALTSQQTFDFDPIKYITWNTSPTTGKPEPTLHLEYKKMWFRAACPTGRMLLTPLRITEKAAIFEAQIYLCRDDPRPISSFTSAVLAQDISGGRYISAAQENALNEALNNAGFGIPLSCLAAGSTDENEKEPTARKTGVPGGKPNDVPELPAVLDTKKQEPLQAISARAADDALEEKPSAKGECSSAEAADAADRTVAEAPLNTPGQSPLNVIQKLAQNAAPEIPDETDTTPPEAGKSNLTRFTSNMTVEDIKSQMTADEAKGIVVNFGTCNGWTMEQVMMDRPTSLKYFMYASPDADNILKAAASILIDEISKARAG